MLKMDHFNEQSQMDNDKVLGQLKDNSKTETNVGENCVSVKDEDGLLGDLIQNSVILSNLFEVCSQKELATLRLVSKRWYEDSLKSWRSSVALQFDSDTLHNYEEDFFWQIPSPGHAYTGKPNIHDTVMNNFLDFVKNPSNQFLLKPYRKFNLAEWHMQEPNDQINLFFQLCGSSITTLELKGFLFQNLSIFRDALYKKCPNLKTLVLKNLSFGWEYHAPLDDEKCKLPAYFTPQENLKSLEIDLDHKSLPITWKEIFYNYPSLKALKVYNMTVEETLIPMLSAINTIRNRDPKMLQLNELDLFSTSSYANEKIDPEACQLIRQISLPLQSLTLDVGVSTELAILHDIIQCHSGTLKKFSAYRGPISVPFKNFLSGLQLNNLEEIIFSDRLCESLTVLKFVPNLRKLTICELGEDKSQMISTDIVKNTDRREMEGVKMLKCEKLRFDYVIDAQDIKSLAEYFPNIEDLRMPLNNDQFRVVCSQWKNMRKLEVLGNQLGDEGITGIPTENVNKINQSQQSAKKLTEISDPIHANITDLKNLRTFTMLDGAVIPTNLNYCSVYYGFLKLANLESLTFATQINSDAIAELKAKIPYCEILQVRTNVNTMDENWEF